MNIAQIEENLQKLIKSINKETFIFDLLLAYGSPKASISRLQKGNLNLSKIDGEISWKKKVFFRPVEQADLHNEITEIAKNLKHDQRFVIVTDFKTLLVIDTRTQDKLDVDLNELPKHFDFFLPWAGMEKAQHANENPADVKAAGKMAKLFDEIKKDNPDNSPEFVHGMNVFLSRLLFCFFAEDTDIFKEGQFINSIDSHTQTDGSDLHTYLDKLFEVLNTPEKERKDLPAYLMAFPYVNGGLFKQKITVPKFSRRSRQSIIDSGELQWKEINPDIFGSMFQSVVSVDQRGNLGQHYTSVPNIKKVIEPLFLNDLYEVFEKSRHEPRALINLLNRISKIKVFDPACGSGNFLIIAYKELRRLEILIIKQLQVLQKIASGFEPKFQQGELFEIPKAQLSLAASFQVELFSRIQLNNFYGIEIDDFAHEIAQLSLWLAEHQMNVEFLKKFGRTNPTLPLREAGQIVHGNACRLDWEKVCPKQEGDEIYVLGNPPYLGARILDTMQKRDIKFVFETKFEGYNDLDYIAPCFYKGGRYIEDTNAKCAFVSTNSICQGSQVATLWPNVLKNKIEIDFVHQSFKWSNNAKEKAAVIVIILGLRNVSNKAKYIFNNSIKISVKNISPYLIEGDNIYVYARRSQISKIPSMNFGSMPNDGGFLTLFPDEYEKLIEQNSNAQKFIKKYVGSKEFINDIPRWCIWIEDDKLEESEKIQFIKDRIAKVKLHRNQSNREATNNLALIPYKFAEVRHKKTNSIIVPRVSSERREYMPIGFLDENNIISDSAQAIYDAKPWIFSMVTSRMHMTWLRTVGGRLKSDYRYSTALCYNTFPFPPITDKQKVELTQCTFRILEEREKHSEKTLAQLYDPDKMPEGLREAHRLNDLAVERCYRSKPFESDEERLEYLFKLYEQMIEEERNRGSLFVTETKKKKKL